MSAVLAALLAGVTFALPLFVLPRALDALFSSPSLRAIVRRAMGIDPNATLVDLPRGLESGKAPDP